MVFGLQKKIKKNFAMFLVLLVLSVVITGCGSNNSNGYAVVDTQGTNQVTGEVEDTANVQPTSEVKTFSLEGANFKFMMNGVESPNIVVNEGDKVRIELKSGQGFHDWVVDEFNVATPRVKDEESTFVEFIADKKGTFEYYCSVGEHRQMGMKGSLIIN